LLDPDVSVEQSIERADKAMYAAKAAGRNCTRIWDPSM
jgi:PleD family two-component response regulator